MHRSPDSIKPVLDDLVFNGFSVEVRSSEDCLRDFNRGTPSEQLVAFKFHGKGYEWSIPFSFMQKEIYHVSPSRVDARDQGFFGLLINDGKVPSSAVESKKATTDTDNPRVPAKPIV